MDIDDDIPIPASPTLKLYPFEELEVGQSFAVPIAKKSSVQAIATRHSRNGKRFTTRTIGDEMRVWRTA